MKMKNTKKNGFCKELRLAKAFSVKSKRIGTNRDSKTQPLEIHSPLWDEYFNRQARCLRFQEA